jgi:thioredoxin-like negative regulator of GroEL
MSSNDDRKNGMTTDERNPDGTFAPGNSGRPRGARHRITRAVEELLKGQSEAITQKAVELALEGDSTALRLCLERVAPTRKGAPVNFDLPPIRSAADATEAAQAVLRAVSQGELTPLEGATVMGLVEQYRRVLETTELEKRIAALEASK